MSFARGGVVAVLLAMGAGVASLVVWWNGTVTLGLTLESDGQLVRVADVTPDGNAHRNHWYPDTSVIEMTTVDGSSVERSDETIGELISDATHLDEHALDEYVAEDFFPQEIYTNFGERIAILEEDSRLPAEAVDPARIESVVAGFVEPGYYVEVSGVLDRPFLEWRLQQSIWIAAVGLLVGGLLWRLLAHGIAGPVGRRVALVVGCAVAAPFLIVPLVQAGTAIGIAAGYLVPAAVALILGLSLAREHPERQWAQTGMVGSAVAAGLAAVIVVRYLSAPTLGSDDRGSIFILMTAIAFVPAVIAAAAPDLPVRERITFGALGLMPAAALLLLASDSFDGTWPIILVGLLTGARLIPTEGHVAALGQGLERIRAGAAMTRVQAADPSVVATRDRLTYGLIGISIFLSVAMTVVGPVGDPVVSAWPLVLGVGLAALVGFGVRRGFLGPDWTDAAVPLAAAVGVPVMVGGGLSFEYGSTVFAVVPTALAALSVAHVLAVRHPDEQWRNRLLAASASVVALIAFLALVGGLEALAVVLVAVVALIPGMIAFADDAGEPRALTSRLETLAVAVTPGIGALVLFPSIGLVLLGAWLVAVVVWRQFTLNPLVGMAQRTQLQRDLAVAAAETERARLAADLHDDALQQITMLVRTLDESGQAAAADEAREIATKLRSVVGDLRLPILDDLGAGAALEWLVERVEPLAGGPVKLERSDEARPPANVELAVFRVAQEALTNAIKHGKAPIAVRYDVRSDGRVTLAVDDAGPGIGPDAAEEAPREGHFGLANMQQRAEQIGALLDVRRWPAGGTRVALEWRPQ
jgi:signal transduction histidine kinase